MTTTSKFVNADKKKRGYDQVLLPVSLLELDFVSYSFWLVVVFLFLLVSGTLSADFFTVCK